MSEALTPTTELEAVNAMLTTIGETPVNTLEDTGLADAEIALARLRRVSAEVQKYGWHFNTEINYPIVPTSPLPGEIKLPQNVLRVDTTGTDANIDVVQRGFRLYDRRNHTYKFDKTLRAEMVVLLAYDELPEAARQYIYLRAARMFQDLTLGSQTIHGFTQRDENNAWVGLLHAEGDTQDHNMLTDNWHAASITRRDRNPVIKL